MERWETIFQERKKKETQAICVQLFFTLSPFA